MTQKQGILILACLLALCTARGQADFPEPDSVTVAAALRDWTKQEYDARVRPDAVSLDRYALFSAQKGWKNLELALNREIGVYYRETGQPDAARFWFERFYNLNVEKQDSLGIALALTHLGNNCIAQGDHENALEYNMTALGIRLRHAKEEEPVKIANSWMFVGVSLSRLWQYDRAADFFQKSLDIRVRQTDSVGYALLMANLGRLEFARGNEALGFHYYQNGMHFRSDAKSPCSWGTFYLDRAEALSARGSYDRALVLLDSCLILLDSCSRPRKQADAHFEKGKIYLLKGNFPLAEQQMEKAVALERKWRAYHRVADFYLAFFRLALKGGNKAKAEAYFNRYEQYKDSVISLQNERSLSRLQIQQELLRKTEAIQNLNRQNEARTRQRNLLLLGLLAALLVIAVIYVLNRARKQSYLRMREQKQAAEALLHEKEQLLQDLHAAQRQLIQHEKMAALGQLTAGIAHELNNPLNFVLNNAETLRLDYEEWKEIQASGKPGLEDLEAEISRLIADIEQGGKRMRNIVQELSLFSRTEAEKAETIDIQTIISESIHLLHIRGNSPWPVTLQIPEKLPLVTGHSGKLVQLFSNLLSNAFDALEARWGTDVAQGQVQISAFSEGQELKIKVADNGAGIPEEVLRKLFDPFFTTKPVGKGTGLGLSIAFAIARAHRGRIEVESVVGVGTGFWVVLPTSTETR